MDNLGQFRVPVGSSGDGTEDDLSVFREFVDHANDLFLLVGGDGCVRFVNQTFCRLTGFAPEEVVGERLPALFEPDERHTVQTRLTSVLQLGSSGAAGLTLRTKGGEGIAVSFRPSVTRDAEGAILRMVLVGQSPYLYGELADQFNSLNRDLKNYSARLERLNTGLEQRIVERTSSLTALLEVSASLNAELQPDALFELILRQAIETIAGAQAGTLMLHDPGIDRLVVHATCGYSDGAIIHDLQAELERTHSRSIFADRTVRVWAGEPRAEAGPMKHLLRNVDQHRIRSAVSVPVACPSEPLGVLLLHNFDEANAFTSDDVALASSLAGSAAIAIVNARLYEETRRQAERLALVNRLSASVGDSVDLEQTLGLAVLGLNLALETNRVAITLFDEAAERAGYSAQYSEPGLKSVEGHRSPLVGTPLMREVMTFRMARAVSDARTDPRIAEARRPLAALGVESLLVIPLVVRDRFLGAVEIHQCDRMRRWLDAEISLAESVSRQVATAVHQVRLHGRLRRAAHESIALFDAMSDAVYVFDGEGRLSRANAAAARREGRPAADLVGVRCCDLFGEGCPVGRVVDGKARIIFERGWGESVIVDALPSGSGAVAVARII